MSTETSNKKNIKFVLEKNPKQSNQLVCSRKGRFIAHTVKMGKESKAIQAPQAHNTKSKSRKSLIIMKTIKDSNSFQSINIDYFQPPNPLSFRIQNNPQVEKLRIFIHTNFSTPTLKLNEGLISQLIEMLPPSELKLIDRLLSNALNIPLHYPFEAPVYRGPVEDCTTINLKGENLVKPEMLRINQGLTRLESHLIKIFFKYVNNFYTVVHPNYFYHRLESDWHHIDFQALLATVLCCSCSYLAVEPFYVPVNYSHLTEFYFERSQTLSRFIDPNDEAKFPCWIQILLLSCQTDYSNTPNKVTNAVELGGKYSGFQDFKKSKECILRTKPHPNNINEIICWEQKLMIWLGLNFYCNMALGCKLPIKGFGFDSKLSDMLPPLNALFDDTSHGSWTDSMEARLLYYLYLCHPILESVRIYNYITLTQYGKGAPLTTKLKLEMEAIKQNLRQWKEKFTQFSESHRFPQNALSLITILHLFYHYLILLLLVPHIPTDSQQLQNPTYIKLYTEFFLSAASLSLLTACQGAWMVIYSPGMTNLVLSVAWSGLRLFLHLVEAFEFKDRYRKLIQLSKVVNTKLIHQLHASFNFTFHQKLTHSLIERRSVLYWLAHRMDHSLLLLSSGLRLRAGCDQPKPPKLSSNSSIDLLN